MLGSLYGAMSPPRCSKAPPTVEVHPRHSTHKPISKFDLLSGHTMQNSQTACNPTVHPDQTDRRMLPLRQIAGCNFLKYNSNHSHQATQDTSSFPEYATSEIPRINGDGDRVQPNCIVSNVSTASRKMVQNVRQIQHLSKMSDCRRACRYGN